MAGRTVVVVEDDHAILELVSEVLTDEGYDVHAFSEASGVVALVRDRRADVVLLDLWLGSDISGWDILQQLRGETATAHVPVIIFSADTKALRHDEEQLRQLNCDLLAKPFALADLLACVAQSTRRSGPAVAGLLTTAGLVPAAAAAL